MLLYRSCTQFTYMRELYVETQIRFKENQTGANINAIHYIL